MMKKLILFVFALILTGATFGQLTGNRYIPGAGGSNDYPTIAAAIADLNLQGTGPGGVTFNIAAGYTETFSSPTAGLITATGTVTSPVVFQKIGAGANPVVTAGVGTTTNVDGIIKIAGGDYITFDGIDLTENPANTNATTQMEWGYALLKARNTFPVDGCQYITIRNCSISLNSTNTASSGIYSGNHIATTNTPAPNGTVYTASDYMNNCKFYGNTISNVYRGINLNGFNDNQNNPPTSFDQNTEIGMAGAGNTITLNVNSSSISYGIWTNFQANPVIAYNSIFVTNTTGGAYGITPRTSNSADIHDNTITVSNSGTSGNTAIDINNAGSVGYTTEVHHNLIQNCVQSGTGSFSGINGGTAGPSVLNIYSNTITGNTAKSGSMSLIGYGGGGGTYNDIYDNHIYNNTKTGAGTLYCINGINYQNCSIHDNLIHANNIATEEVVTGAATISGIQSGQNNQTTETIFNNQIYDLNITGTTTSAANFIYGINTDILPTANRSWYNNVVRNLSINALMGSGTVIGMRIANGNSGNIFKNQVYDLTAGNAAGSVQGINISSGTKVYVYNNFISDLRTPDATGPTAINGITVAGGITAGVYFNTIYLNAVSTGSTFGTSGIYKTGATTLLDLRNNLVLNNSTAGISGGLTVAYRSSGVYNTAYYSESSDGNNFYAGVPGANNLIFSDGLSSDQTLSAYQLRVAPKDATSFSENTTLINTSSTPYDLHTDAAVPTLCESGGIAITNPLITVDFDGHPRSSTPDVGADEFAGILIGVVNPTGFTARAVSSREISLSFQGNLAGDNVVIVWNNTGYFTTPSGSLPAISSIFAGGTVLSAGTASPLSHSELMGGTTYYYKAFSFNGTSYSSGVTANAVTSVAPPASIFGYAMSVSQVNLNWTKNPLDNDVIIAVNSSATFGQPVNGTIYTAGSNLPSGGNVLYVGPLSTFSHTGLTTNTKYYYKVWSVDAYAWYSATGATTNTTTMLCGPTATIPFIEGFEAYTPPAVGCGTIIDQNGDGNTWRTLQGGSPTPHGGTKHLVITAGGPQSNNDWYFIQGLELTGGMKYQLTFWYRPQYTSLAKVFEVKWGTSPTPDDMYSEPLANVQVSSIIATYAQTTCYFTPSVSGVYYLGWHDMSPYDGNNLYLDDINVSGNTCSPPLTVSSGTVTSTSAEISWTGGGANMQVEYGNAGHAAGTGTIVTVTASPAMLASLTPATKYDVYVRQDCGLGVYSFWTGPVTFTTTFVPSAVTTDPATALTGSSATLNGTVNANGTITAVYFEYGLTTAYGSYATSSPSTVSGSVPTAVSSTVNGLIANGVTYHYRAIGYSGGVFSYGSDQVFVTSSAAPVATTLAATSISATGANLNGVVLANNALSDVTFEYGTAPGVYNSVAVSAVPSPVTGGLGTSVTATLAGLVPGQIYYFRVNSTNAFGTTNGGELSFTAADLPSTVTNPATVSPTTAAVTLNGTVNANGFSTAVTFQYGATTAYGTTVTASQSPVAGTDATAVSSALALTMNTLYHYRVVAVNSGGTSYGEDMTFTTGTLPTATTTAATFSATAITLNGTVSWNNATTQGGFEYGPTVSYGSAIAYPSNPITSNNRSIPTPVKDLLPSTVYHYRAYATNVGGTVYGSDLTFTTPAYATATTLAATPVGSTTATLKGTCVANWTTTTNFRFEYGLTSSYGTVVTPSPGSGTGTTVYNPSGSVTGLIPNTTYHYRVYATNGFATVYGSDMTFTTTPVVPVVNTLSTFGITPTGAILNGMVNPKNSTSTSSFEYGLTNSYGTVASSVPSVLNGNSEQGVSLVISGLQPNTMYYYRATATNSAGTTNGTGLTFTTLPVLPTVFTSPAGMVSTTGATLQGLVNANNAGTTVVFEFGQTSGYGQTFSALPSIVDGITGVAVSFDISGLIPNTTYHYRVVGINAAGISYGNDMVLQTPEFNASFSANPVQPLCYGGTGSVILGTPAGGTPPYHFDPANPPLTGLNPGTYTYYLTDATGYPAQATAIINAAPDQLVLEAVAIHHPNCFGDETGIVSLNTFGGTPGYTYDPMNPPLNGLAGGTYTYHVTDANGCTASATVTVNAAPILVINNPGICFPGLVNLTNPSVTAGSILNGSALSYWLDANASVPLANPASVGAGTYYIKATLNELCFDIQPVVAYIYPVPNRYYVTGGGSYCAGESGAVVGVDGSQVGVNYSLWNLAGPISGVLPSTGGPVSFGPQTTTGIILVLAEDATTGCTNWMYNSVNISVNQPVPVSVSITVSANPSAAGQNVTCTAVPVNGGYFPVYQWKVNGLNSGPNAAVYTFAPVNGDQVSCELISSLPCVSGSPAFSGLITMEVTNVPATLEVSGVVLPGETRCYDALQTIFVAGNGTTYTIPGNSSVEMIAGQNIVYQPGSAVQPGGYLYGHISQTFCGQQLPSMVTVATGTGEGIDGNQTNFYRVHPNPTSGDFTLATMGDIKLLNVNVEIYNIRGERVLSQTLIGENKHTFSFSAMASGLYFVKVISGTEVHTVKLIKTR